MKVISFSLYGSHPMYYEGMLRNAELAAKIYPDWGVWCYVGPEVNGDWRNKLASRGVKVVDASTAFAGTCLAKRNKFTGTFWRFLAARDKGVKIMISRDADSRLNVREKAAVDAWLSSGKKYHVMRDHQNHKRWLMLAGMWGVVGHFDMLSLLMDFKLCGRRGEDQEFLRSRVWPLARKNCIEHGYGGLPMPPHPAYTGFVGQRFTENDVGLQD